jgi:hypothetical protein
VVGGSAIALKILVEDEREDDMLFKTFSLFIQGFISMTKCFFDFQIVVFGFPNFIF